MHGSDGKDERSASTTMLPGRVDRAPRRTRPSLRSTDAGSLERDPPPRPGRTASLVLAALLLVHLAACASLFGPALSGRRPVLDHDFGMHYHRARVLSRSENFPGLAWDPSSMAGAPVGGVTDVDNRVGEIALRLVPFLPPATAFHLALVALFTAVPLLVHRAARTAGLSSGASTIAAFLAVLLFWNMRSYWLAFVAWGMYGWVLAAASVPLWFASFSRCLERPSAGPALRLAGSTVLAGLAHALCAVLLPLLAVLLLLRAPQVRRRTVLALATAVTLAALALLPFASPVLRTLAESGTTTAGFLHYFQASPAELHSALREPQRALANVLLLLAACAVFRRNLSRTLRELAGCAVAIAAFSYGAFLVPATAPLEPVRFVTLATFLAAVPAAALVAEALASAGLRTPSSARVLAVCLGAVLVSTPLYELAASLRQQRRFVTEPDPASSALVARLRQHTSEAHRVLIEDGGTGFGGLPYGDTNLLGTLADELGRELIGGPHPATACRVGWATLLNGVLFGRPLDRWTDAELEAFATAYDVETVVVWSEAGKRRFDALAWPREDVQHFAVYETGRARGRVEGGESCRAQAEVDRISVEDATTPSTLLRWHYDPRWRCEPPLPVKEEASPFGPVGFLRVENGDVERFVLRYDD